MRYANQVVVAAGCCLSSLCAAQYVTHYPGAMGPAYKMTAIEGDSAGDVYATGTVAGSHLQAVTVKVGPTGSKLWANTLAYSGADFIPAKMAFDNLGNVLLEGQTQFSSTSAFLNVSKVSPAGATVFSREFGLGGYSMSAGIGSDASGNIYWAGTGTSGTRNYIHVFCLNSNGTNKWGAMLGTSAAGNSANAFGVDSLGNTFVAGTYYLSGGSWLELYKLDKNGTVVWHYIYSLPAGDFAAPFALKLDSSDNVYITGVQRLSTQAYPDVLTLRVNANGTLSWKQVFNNTSDNTDEGVAIGLDSAKSVYVAAATYVNQVGYRTILLKYSNAGTLVGKSMPTFTGPTVVPHFMQVDAKDRIFIAMDGAFKPGDVSADVFGAYFDPQMNMKFVSEFGLGSGSTTGGVYSDSQGFMVFGASSAVGYGSLNYYLQKLHTYPVAVADRYYANYGSPLSVSAALGVQANDVYAEGTTATLSGAGSGSITLQPSGAFTWSNGATFFGSDAFQYYDASTWASSYSATCTIIVVPVLSSLSVAPNPQVGGASSTGKITLNHAVGSVAVVARLWSSNPAVASVPATVTAGVGATSATFAVTTHAVSTVQTITISANWNGTVKTATLTVNP